LEIQSQKQKLAAKAAPTKLERFRFKRLQFQLVIPAKAGIQPFVHITAICPKSQSWIPAFAGMTR
jgi:hypothetical protein